MRPHVEGKAAAEVADLAGDDIQGSLLELTVVLRLGSSRRRQQAQSAAPAQTNFMSLSPYPRRGVAGRR
jgi:hypothetical protein